MIAKGSEMIELTKEFLTDGLKKQIYEGFSHHAIEETGYDEKFDPVAFIARTKNGQFAGAIVGELFWGTFHIKYVYIVKEHRGQRIASKLMENALNYGKENKCPFAFVETMSFQALDFYQKLGFQLEYTRTGYAHGTSFHYLRKDLGE